MNNKAFNILSAYKEYGTIGEADITYLKEQGIINGIGGNDSLLTKYVDHIQKLPHFNESKFGKWIEDFENGVIVYHDIEFTIGGNYVDFTKSNFDLALGFYKQLQWSNKFIIIPLAISLFFATQLGGTKCFNFN